MNRSQQALNIIRREGVTAREAARQVGISPAAVSKAKLHPSEKQQLKDALTTHVARCPRCNHEFPHHWSGCGSVHTIGDE